MASASARATWYSLLAQRLGVGLSLYDTITDTPGLRAQERADLIAALGDRELAAALDAKTPWLDPLDRAVWVAARQTGKLPEAFSLLAEHYRSLHQTKMKVLMSLIYPFFLIHAVALALPVIDQTIGAVDLESTTPFCFDQNAYLTAAGANLALLWGVLLLGSFVVQSFPTALGKLFGWLPLIAQFRRAQGLERFSRLLGEMIGAGLALEPALRLAGKASRHPAIARDAELLAQAAAHGRAPGTLMPAQAAWPQEFVAIYQTAEKTGQLDTALAERARHYHTVANRWLMGAAFFYPQLIFAAVGGVMIMEIFRFYSSYLHGIEKMGQPGW